MWELTRSAVRFTWTLSRFGAQQMVNLLRPSRAAGAFDHATRAMEGELESWLRPAVGSASDPKRLRSPGDRSVHPAWQPGASGGTTPPGEAVPQAGPAEDRPAVARSPGWGPVPYPVLGPGDPAPGDSSRGSAPAGADREPATQPASSRPGREPISSEYPFEGHFVEVHGARMHYVEVGSGRPILFLHGNPTWSYLWRNVLPHLQPLGRCIAPDLVGFGRSSKPSIEYRWADHVRYVEGFIATLGLEDVVLVLHDQGSNLGFHYAMRHQDNVRALAFFEAILRPYPWDQFSTPEFRELFRQFRSGGVGGPGWQMVVEQNVFIEQLLPQAAGRALSAREMGFYREPFPSSESRVPVWRWPRETPIGGEPPDVWEAVSAYSAALQRSPLPKLLLYAHPGALVTEEHRQWAVRSLPNLETVDLGAGSHFLQESSPHQIGRAIARWLAALPDDGGQR